MADLTCFMAYDIRGRLADELFEGILRRVGRAFDKALTARRVVVGRSRRASSAALLDACIASLVVGLSEVIDLGLRRTEEMYLEVTHFESDGGIEVTA